MEFMNEDPSVSETIDISNSADWIKFEYWNMESTSNELSFSAQEQNTTCPVNIRMW